MEVPALSPDVGIVIDSVARALEDRRLSPGLISDTAPQWQNALPDHVITIEYTPRPAKGSKPRPKASYTISIVGERVNGRWRLWAGEFESLIEGRSSQ